MAEGRRSEEACPRAGELVLSEAEGILQPRDLTTHGLSRGMLRYLSEKGLLIREVLFRRHY